MKYEFDDQTKNVCTSVREICGFLYRSGDVYSGGMDISGEAMLEGAKLHRALQRQREKENPEYMSEYRIKSVDECEGFTYEISGILDGVLPQGDATVIDEFKTTGRDLDELEWDTISAYSAQLMCYGYMYALENNLNFVTLKLTYYNYDSDATKEIVKEMSFTALSEWYCGMLSEYTRWAKLVYDNKMSRNASVKNVTFPFDSYRAGQRELAAKVYRSIRDGKRLFAQAPTGIGKTVSTLFPSVKALGEYCGDKIFYLSAKTPGAIAANDCIELLRSGGLDVRNVQLTSKERICPFEQNCLPTECEYSKGHYDRVNAALFDLVSNNRRITKELLLSFAEKYKVCPFELQLDASEYCDIVVGDYNYVFDPKAHLMRYFSDGGDYIVLVDEAHNLVDRAREMYSAQMSYFRLLGGIKHFKKLRKLSNRLRKCVAVMERVSEPLNDKKLNCTLSVTENDITPFRLFCEAYRKLLSESGNEDVKKSTLELFFDISFFVEIFDLADVVPDAFVDYCTLDGEDAVLHLFCADPSQLITLCTDKVRSTVFFSATLSPFEYYIKMLGANSDNSDRAKDEIMSVPSPFPRENLLCCVYNNLSTRFKDRQNSMETICEIIGRVCTVRNGNYMAFFPSYSYMMNAFDMFCEMYPTVVAIMQSQSMTPEERSEFLSSFEVQNDKVKVAFVLCGGVFSEGVDLRGDRLSGAVIVGTGLPSLCFERDLLKHHFDKTVGEGRGYNFAYTYTGLNRVYQAGGRVIRTATDRGFVVLADDRYTKMSHRRTFPDSWSGAKRFSDIESLEKCVELFWNEKKQS